MAKFDYHEFSPIEIYNMVLQGKVIKRFPRGFWQDEEGMENARVIIKYLFEERLGWTDEEVLNNISARIFQTNGLWGLLSNTFKHSPFAAYNHAYPGKFKPWEFKQTPLNFWSIETGIEATAWLIEEKLKWSHEEIIENLTGDIFTENGLGGMIQYAFHNHPFEAITQTYPGKFNAWEFRQTPKEFWSRENSIRAIKWMIEDKLKWTEEDIRNNLNAATFLDNGLSGLLSNKFDNSPYKALNFAYPDKFKPWELSKVPRDFWNRSTAILATKWMVEEKLKLTREEIPKITSADFQRFGLSGMLMVVFQGKYREALKAAYPEIEGLPAARSIRECDV